VPLTISTMRALGTPAPDFDLSDVVTGHRISLETFADQSALLVMFICRHCPFVQHVQQELARIGRDYADRGLGIAGISSSDLEAFPRDRPESLREQAIELGFNFPYCCDETQHVAQSYGASCTPDFFLFDAQRHLAYRGRLDDSRPQSAIPVTGRDLRAAIDAVLAGRPATVSQSPSLGCNIKWKPGREPTYYESTLFAQAAPAR
jgi:peroxiredoxin